MRLFHPQELRKWSLFTAGGAGANPKIACTQNAPPSERAPPQFPCTEIYAPPYLHQPPSAVNNDTSLSRRNNLQCSKRYLFRDSLSVINQYVEIYSSYWCPDINLKIIFASRNGPFFKSPPPTKLYGKLPKDSFINLSW